MLLSFNRLITNIYFLTSSRTNFLPDVLQCPVLIFRPGLTFHSFRFQTIGLVIYHHTKSYFKALAKMTNESHRDFPY